MPASSVTDRPAEHRFELEADGRTAFLTYRREPGRLVLLHTEVPEDLEGQGLGGTLVRAALDGAREAGEQVVPLCPFVHAWVEKHPEYADLMASGGTGGRGR
jgi:predicted GNAT family acetyltransferase